jgi:hypothetical protein
VCMPAMHTRIAASRQLSATALASMAACARSNRRWITIRTKSPGRNGIAGRIHHNHLGILALPTKLLGGVNREQRGDALAAVGAEFIAVECDEPGAFPARNQITNTRRDRHKGRPVIAILNVWHDIPLIDGCTPTQSYGDGSARRPSCGVAKPTSLTVAAQQDVSFGIKGHQQLHDSRTAFEFEVLCEFSRNDARDFKFATPAMRNVNNDH